MISIVQNLKENKKELSHESHSSTLSAEATGSRTPGGFGHDQSSTDVQEEKFLAGIGCAPTFWRRQAPTSAQRAAAIH